jgi:hypothetical protein
MAVYRGIADLVDDQELGLLEDFLPSLIWLSEKNLGRDAISAMGLAKEVMLSLISEN